MADGPDKHGSHAEEVSTSAHLETAFRTAEKKYQLHMKQRLKKTKNGRVRGGELVAQPTDFSDVVDTRSPSSTAPVVEQQLQCTLPPVLQQEQRMPLISSTEDQKQQQQKDRQPSQHPAGQGQQTPQIQQPQPQQQQQQQCCVASSVKLLTFPTHPGLVVFPAALPVQLQLQLMRAALQEWPEPPTRTNHTAAYGMQLKGLFDAAQAGLSLNVQPGVQQKPQTSGRQQQQQLLRGRTEEQKDKQQQQEKQQLQQLQQLQQQEKQQEKQQLQGDCQCHFVSDVAAPTHQKCGMVPDCSSCCCAGRSTSLPATVPQPPAAQPCSCSGPQVWSPGGAGAQASVLLRKLRWVSLGPPYNWAGRVYEPHVPHRPLPSELVQLAEHFAGLAKARHIGNGGDVCSSIAADTRAAAAATIQSGMQAEAAAQPAGFTPDVALVSYYQPGDTLNGHTDDAERDMLQPIVTISLGCAAVFLMGGPSRQQQPTPLLLRSGDVVVLEAAARACYHGVPRVLDSWEGVTNSVCDAVSGTDKLGGSDSVCAVWQRGEELTVLKKEEYRAVLTHMRQCRVNISVRSSL